MRCFAIAMIGLMLAGCVPQEPLTPAPPLATILPLPTATPPATAGCLFGLGLSAFPQGTLATISAIDGWSTDHWQLAVNIDGTLILSGTSRVYILDTMTETLRVSTGQTSAENSRRLQSLIESAEFAALETCYQGNVSDGGSMSFQARSPHGVKNIDVWAAGFPSPLEEIWRLMSTLSSDAQIPVSTCVYVTRLSRSGRATTLESCG